MLSCDDSAFSAKTANGARGRSARRTASGSRPTSPTRAAVAALAAHCLGHELRNGRVLHAGFFLGPRNFYAALRELSERELRQFDMRGVGWINQLYGPDAELRTLQRRDARFVNTTMMVTMLGAAISDTLEDGRVVSGVGGQYNFVAMAHALPGARSILCLRATTRRRRRRVALEPGLELRQCDDPAAPARPGGHRVRHRRPARQDRRRMRRGAAEHRRFTVPAGTAPSARAAGKLPADHVIPEPFRHNTPQRLERALASHRRAGLFSDYPFGTDLTDEEVELGNALRLLREATATPWSRQRTVTAATFARAAAADLPALRRMSLERPTDSRERLLRGLVLWALHRYEALGDLDSGSIH